MEDEKTRKIRDIHGDVVNVRMAPSLPSFIMYFDLNVY